MDDWFGNMVKKFCGRLDFTKFEGPVKQIVGNETFVGELDETGKKLWCLRENAVDRSYEADFQLHIDHGGKPNEDSERNRAEYTVAALQRQALNVLLWVHIHSAFPSTLDVRLKVGLRSGWKVVTYPCPSPG